MERVVQNLVDQRQRSQRQLPVGLAPMAQVFEEARMKDRLTLLRHRTQRRREVR